MSILIKHIKGQFGTQEDQELSGCAMLPINRVVLPHLRFDGTNAVLLLDDPGIQVPEGVTRVLHVRATRIQTSAGLKLINTLRTYHLGFPRGATTQLAAYVEVELGGLAGDWAIYNGAHVLQMMPSGPGPQGDYYLKLTVGVGFGIQMHHSLGSKKWFVRVVNFDAPDYVQCQKFFGKDDVDAEDPEGSYGETTCSSAGCDDPNSCTNSAGATCRVRWAGATWV